MPGNQGEPPSPPSNYQQQLSPNTLLRTNSEQSNRNSLHSLHALPSRSDHGLSQHEQNLMGIAGEGSGSQHQLDLEDDAASDSSGSDQEEDAGLISRLSDEEDRKARRSKYNSNRGGSSRIKRVGEIQGYGEEDDEDQDEEQQVGGRSNIDVVKANRYHREDVPLYDEDDNEDEGPHSPRGFADRSETHGMIFKKGVAGQMWEIGREAIPTLILSVFSLMFSGELLVHLARWPVFVKCDKLFILTPILLNLKGNLEMNLSLRMSTSANIGELDIRRTRQTLIKGNLALLQVQALIVSSFAGLLAFVLGVAMPENEAPSSGSGSGKGNSKNRNVDLLLSSTISMVRSRFSKRGAVGPPSSSALQPRRIIHHHHEATDPALKLRNGYFEFVLVLATGMLSASLSSAILGSFMCALVVVTRRLGGNPDNIASPLAASLGDLLTLTLLGLLGSVMIKFEGTFLATLILIGLVVACTSCFVVTYRNAYVRELLSSGWIPLLVAMFISSGAGLVLDAFVQKYEGFALLAPVVTGLPGACGAIFASRISTVLHSGEGKAGAESSTMGTGGRNRSNRKRTFSCFSFLNKFGIGPLAEGWLVPITLLSIAISINSVFLLLVWSTGQMSFGWPFVICFMAISTSAGCIALFLSHCICHFLWSRDYDPDVYCLPYVSSLVDVIGQALLVLAFATATMLGDNITAAVNAGEGHGGM